MHSRRKFIAAIGAAAVAPRALHASQPAVESSVPLGNGQYVVGVISNPLLPPPAGQRVLHAWLAVGADGTGFGVVSDRYGSHSGSHLSVQSTLVRGNRSLWQGVVTRSTDPTLVGQPFELSATERNGVAWLALALMGQTFSGRGVITD